jgi:cyclopropane-fatty-acyl-phospholipid synthase
MFGAPFERAWRLYLSGSQAAFLAGSLQLFQVVFAPAGKNSIPWTREIVNESPGSGAFGDSGSGSDAHV